MKQQIRYSWDTWRGKVNLKLDEYDPKVIEGIIETMQSLDDKITALRNDLSDIDATFNGLFQVIDFGAIGAINNIEPVLKEQ